LKAREEQVGSIKEQLTCLLLKERTMKRTLVAVADLGCFKAFKLVRGVGDSRPHLELVGKTLQQEVRTRISDQVTDNAGRFPRVSGSRDVSRPGMSIGDRHDLVLEQQRRAIQSIADELNTMLSDDQFVACWLAVASSIHQSLLSALKPRVKAKIDKFLALDLTKSDPKDVIQHFELA